MGSNTRHEVPDLIDELIDEFTYAGIFILLFLGGLGVPIPEEAPIFAAGVLSAEAVIHWWVALPVCFVGVLSGDVVLYWIGHHWGERILDWRAVRYILTPERERNLVERYHRHGVKIVFTARYVMGIRAAAFLTAGIVRLPFWKFLTIDAVAAAIGVPIGFGLPFFFTEQLHGILDDVRRVERWAIMAAVVAVAVWIAVAAWRRRREEL